MAAGKYERISYPQRVKRCLRIVKMYRSGMTQQAIGKKEGLHRATVSKIVTWYNRRELKQDRARRNGR